MNNTFAAIVSDAVHEYLVIIHDYDPSTALISAQKAFHAVQADLGESLRAEFAVHLPAAVCGRVDVIICADLDSDVTCEGLDDAWETLYEYVDGSGGSLLPPAILDQLRRVLGALQGGYAHTDFMRVVVNPAADYLHLDIAIKYGSVLAVRLPNARETARQQAYHQADAETMKVIVVSTCHMPDTNALTRLIEADKMTAAEGPEGGFIVLPEESTSVHLLPDEFDWIKPLAAHAYTAGARIIRLDRDGPMIPFLPAYDW